MKTIVEIHALQNFAPSNLNRDDTGAPKDALFGGTRRARVSSHAPSVQYGSILRVWLSKTCWAQTMWQSVPNGCSTP